MRHWAIPYETSMFFLSPLFLNFLLFQIFFSRSSPMSQTWLLMSFPRQILQMFQKQVFLPSDETFRCLLFFHLLIYMKCTYQSCHQWVIHMQHVFQHWHHCVATPQSTPCYTDHCECRAKACHSWLCSAVSPTPAKVLYPPSLTHPQALHPLSSCVCNCCLSYQNQRN